MIIQDSLPVMQFKIVFVSVSLSLSPYKKMIYLCVMRI